MSFALDQGFTTIIGDVLPENEAMLKLARSLSFDVSYDIDVDLMRVARELRAGGCSVLAIDKRRKTTGMDPCHG